MINKCKSTKRLPGCYAEFITFAVLLRKHINQGLFIRILKKEKKKKQWTVLGAAILSIVKELRRTLILTSRANKESLDKRCQ